MIGWIMLTAERVRYLFDYEGETGLLRRRVTLCGRALAGRVVGTRSSKKKKYLRVGVDGQLYAVHRIIWLWFYGKWPKNLLDHRDLDETNNRIRNLREATNSQNKCNGKVRSDSQTGIRGVTEDKRTGRFRAHIAIMGNRKWLGFFGTKTEAAAARRDALHLHGEFARE